jgi:hypothetical protein
MVNRSRSIIIVTRRGDERVAARRSSRRSRIWCARDRIRVVLISKAVRNYAYQVERIRSLENRYQALLLDNVRDAVVVDSRAITLNPNGWAGRAQMIGAGGELTPLFSPPPIPYPQKPVPGRGGPLCARQPRGNHRTFAHHPFAR